MIGWKEIKLADITNEAFETVLEYVISGYIGDAHQRVRYHQDRTVLLDKPNLPPFEERMNLMPAMRIYLAAEELRIETVKQEALHLIEMAFLEDIGRWLDRLGSHAEGDFKMRPGLPVTSLQDILARTTPMSDLWHF